MSSYYSSTLSYNHSRYARYVGAQALYYYEAIEVKVSTSDTVTFISNSSVDMCGSLYNNTFDPMFPSLNLVAFDDDGAGNLQFLLNLILDPNVVYILVPTTFGAKCDNVFQNICVMLKCYRSLESN